MSKTQYDEFIPKINYQVCRKCGPEWRINPFIVRDYDLTYVFRGKARYTVDGIPYELNPGDLLFLTKDAEKEATTYPDDLMHCFAVNFTSKNIGETVKPPNFPVFSQIRLRRDIINMFNELTFCWTNQFDGYIMKSRALLMLILQRLSEIILGREEIESADWRVNKITRYISMHYSEKLTIKGLAVSLGLNEEYFGRLFRHETGMGLRHYIAHVRVRNAENLLRSGEFPVSDVAEYCGFSDIFHFYKTFKRLRGTTPAALIP
jgi:YesN/AraC family two-component response regulator